MKKENIFVSMSGGVDSSLAAALLAGGEREVTGITLRLWCYGDEPGTDRSCCSLQAVEDARTVAHSLGVPHFVWNMENEFRKEVIEDFCAEYARGRTPNPCVRCNSRVRFGTMLEKCLGLGADAMATGHYARLDYDSAKKRFRLMKGLDPVKDQSYFLWGIPPERLEKVRFPIGDLAKTDTRKLAREMGLPVAEKRESQDICFIPDGDYTAFYRKRCNRRDEPGEIRDREDRVLGIHQGLAGFTIGQRRGLGVAAGRPLYVTALESETNVLRVGTEEDLLAQTFTVSQVNWMDPETKGRDTDCTAKIRSTHAGAPASIHWEDPTLITIAFDRPEKAITPGQSAVFYDGDEVLGGGVIETVDPGIT